MTLPSVSTSLEADMKVAYLIVTRTFPGLLKQVSYDRFFTSKLDGIVWDHFTFLDKVEEGGEAKKLPALFTGVFGRKLFAWFWLLRYATRYDYVVVRHMEFDPFALIFAWFVPNRVLVHHSKEVLELRQIRKGWKGRAASWLENISGRVATRTARALVGVTHEIGIYQKQFRRLPQAFPIGFFPNGVVVDTMPNIIDERSSDTISLGFMSGSFAAWHGLDRLLDGLEDYFGADAPVPIRLELIGRLTEAQLAHVEQVNAAASTEVVIVHGRLKQDEYLKVLGKCHIGIGSLAMDRIELSEGATLKVREMLALGLPVYSGHVDTALPPDFPYYVNGNVDVSAIVEFVRTMSNVPREAVREAARPYIDKQVWIAKFGEFLMGLHGTGSTEGMRK